jgi:hypothetical protein
VYGLSLTEHHPFTRLMVDLPLAEVSIWGFARMTTVLPVYSRRAFPFGALRINPSGSPLPGEAQVGT